MNIYDVWTEGRNAEDSPLTVKATSHEDAAKRSAIYWDNHPEHEDMILNYRPVATHVRLQAMEEPWTSFDVSGRVSAHYDVVPLVTIAKP